jgi:hypothetical protein
MVRYVVAKYCGETSHHYETGNQYPLAIKTRLFSHRVSIYRRHGYHDEMVPGSLVEYEDWYDFSVDWKLIKDGGNE